MDDERLPVSWPFDALAEIGMVVPADDEVDALHLPCKIFVAGRAHMREGDDDLGALLPESLHLAPGHPHIVGIDRDIRARVGDEGEVRGDQAEESERGPVDLDDRGRPDGQSKGGVVGHEVCREEREPGMTGGIQVMRRPIIELVVARTGRGVAREAHGLQFWLAAIGGVQRTGQVVPGREQHPPVDLCGDRILRTCDPLEAPD